MSMSILQRIVSFSTTYIDMPREDMKYIKLYHNQEREKATLAMQNAATPADYEAAKKSLAEHEKGFHKATQAAKEYRTAMDKLGHAFETLSRYGVVANILYGSVNAVREIVTEVIHLEDEMKNIQAITSSSESGMAVLGQSIKNIASTTAFSITDIAGAVKTLHDFQTT